MTLKKDKENAMLAGVCAGIAKEMNLDITLVRLGFAVATLFFGSALLIYLVLAIIMPNE